MRVAELTAVTAGPSRSMTGKCGVKDSTVLHITTRNDRDEKISINVALTSSSKRDWWVAVSRGGGREREIKKKEKRIKQ